jgi:hypothetical protein
MAIAHIRKPADIALPTSEELLDALSILDARERDQVLRQIFEALETSQAANDFRPFIDVVLGWYRTALLRRDPEHEQVMAEARARAKNGAPEGEQTQTVEELRREVDELSRKLTA